MRIDKRLRWIWSIVVFGSALAWGLSGAIIHAAENHNSSRSNRGQTIAYPGPGSSGGAVPLTAIKSILNEIDTVPASQINEKMLTGLLKKYGVTGINKIVVEKGEGEQRRILLLQDPKNEIAARTVAVKEEGVKN